ncbi:hypothetical protein RHIZO_02574 [Rhizobiaceae bacterium]|nr:hypothetical protein RHIZO_02574 [Rhizobiaceae bacterium]
MFGRIRGTLPSGLPAISPSGVKIACEVAA